ncbi:MAG TPA: hypothetical protein ENH23_07250 [candidate division Zixibacteria bacterium]|nr:hypothetical protein [candidate division Zixibacteria bacterium]
MRERIEKPIIETMINTCALTLTATGTAILLKEDWFGFLIILFGAGLEFFKYWGRKENYW